MTLAPIHELGPASKFSDAPVVLPRTLTAEYNNFCNLQDMAHHRACCPKDLFEYGLATKLSEMDCDMMIIPETMSGTEYYNPLFINDVEKEEVKNTGTIVKLRNFYREITNEVRGKHQNHSLARAFRCLFSPLCVVIDATLMRPPRLRGWRKFASVYL